MSNFRTAYRYAEAFMATAEDQGVLKNVSSDLHLLQRLYADSHEFQLFLKSPVIKKDKKREVLEVLCTPLVQPLTLRFLFLLTEKQREDLLPVVIGAFFQLEDEALGILRVHVVSATDLTKDQEEALKKRFASITQKKVQLQVSKDPHLLGGFAARIGDTMYDGSIKHQLEILRKRFAEGASYAS